MRTRFRTVVLVFVVAGVVVQVAGAAPIIRDKTGDTSAADVASVTVADKKSGVITFVVELANRSRLDVNDQLFLFLDTDRNKSTGDRVAPRDRWGADYYLFLSGKRGYVVARLSGKKSALVKAKTAKTACCTDGYWVFSIDKRELGSPKALDLYVWTHYADPAKNRFDYAPDKGVHTYRLTA